MRETVLLSEGTQVRTPHYKLHQRSLPGGNDSSKCEDKQRGRSKFTDPVVNKTRTAVASEPKPQHFADSSFYYSLFHFAAPKAEKACKPSVAGPSYGPADPAAQKNHHTVLHSARLLFCTYGFFFSAPLRNGCTQRVGGGGGGGVEK